MYIVLAVLCREGVGVAIQFPGPGGARQEKNAVFEGYVLILLQREAEFRRFGIEDVLA